MMASFMHVSYMLVFHQSKCFSAIKHILYTSGSQPFLMHSSLGSFWNFSFLPYYNFSRAAEKVQTSFLR